MTAIDLFAGGGGFTQAAEQAGVTVLWAANHWPEAVQVHALNHPNVQHSCQDLHQANWFEVPAHDLLLASPACQGHSRARGGRETLQHDRDRSTAWAVVSALEVHRPAFAIVENVPDFLDWTLFPAWQTAIRALGYSLAPHLIDSADLGAPQSRPRVFIILSRSKEPLRLNLPERDPLPASSVLDFTAGRWSAIEKPGRAERTLERVRNGRAEHGSRFLVAYYGQNRGGRSINRPIGTLTTTDRYALIDGDRMRMLSVREAKAFMGFPDTYRLTGRHRDDMRLLGNAVQVNAASQIIAAVRAQA